MSLKSLLDLVLPQFAPTLIDDCARTALELASLGMAPIARVAIECRLAGGDTQVDIQQQLRKDSGDAQLLKRHLEESSGRCGAQSALLRFCEAWAAGGNALAGIDEVFLEYDVPSGGEGAARIPGLFFSLPREGDWATAHEAISLLCEPAPSNGPADALRSCFDALETSRAWIGYLGLFFNRAGNPMRVNVKGLRPHAFRPLLKALGWSGDLDRAENLFGWAIDRADRVTVALDIGNGALLPRLGFECILNRQPAVERRWSMLLEDLEWQGLCDGDKRSAVLAAPGLTLPTIDGKPWLPQWIARSLAAPADHFSAIETALYYIKLTLEPDGAREAKAYFGVRDVWLVQEAGGIREAPPQAPVCAIAPAASTETMIQRAIAAILERQGQNGLWRDFLLFNDESTEWVSAFVATALVEAGGLSISGAAADAMSSLASQQRPNGGWGYDRASEADADSTAWALRFHALLGGLGKDVEERAVRFLHAHAKTGGIATYRESADLTVFAIVAPNLPGDGWKQAHCCVTAAAFPFVGSSVLPYLAAEQEADGSWQSYWWYNRAYPTAICAEALATSASYDASVEAACLWAAQEAIRPDLNDFDAAWCLRALILRPDDAAVRGAAQKIVERLRERQLPDGRWQTGALARFPMPDILVPDASDRVTPFQDQHGLFTTAAVLAALTRWRDGKYES